MGLLDLPWPRRTRRNHAIEHATVHILTARQPRVSLAGRADGGGFYLYGNVTAAAVHEAVEEAIRRLGAEPELAIHPHCGTNLVVGGFTAGLAALVAVATFPRQRRLDSPWSLLPRLTLAGTAAALASANLGPIIQARWTTLADVRNVRVAAVRQVSGGRHTLHRVELRDEGG